jgi:hypothetical protein
MTVPQECPIALSFATPRRARIQSAAAAKSPDWLHAARGRRPKAAAPTNTPRLSIFMASSTDELKV